MKKKSQKKSKPHFWHLPKFIVVPKEEVERYVHALPSYQEYQRDLTEQRS